MTEAAVAGSNTARNGVRRTTGKLMNVAARSRTDQLVRQEIDVGVEVALARESCARRLAFPSAWEARPILRALLDAVGTALVVANDAIRRTAATGQALSETTAEAVAYLIGRRTSIERAHFAGPATLADRARARAGHSIGWTVAPSDCLRSALQVARRETLAAARLIRARKTADAAGTALPHAQRRQPIAINVVAQERADRFGKMQRRSRHVNDRKIGVNDCIRLLKGCCNAAVVCSGRVQRGRCVESWQSHHPPSRSV
jgi:hypothetical protein